MSKYKHDDWFCKTANEAEAHEIIARALVSGAVLYQSVGDGINKNRWDLREYWGVVSGHTINLHNVLYVNCTIYTIEQVREKFPLPSELQGNVAPHCERELWVENAAISLHKEAVLTPEQASFAAGKIYDALKSGNLKAPEV